MHRQFPTPFQPLEITPEAPVSGHCANAKVPMVEILEPGFSRRVVADCEAKVDLDVMAFPRPLLPLLNDLQHSAQS